jgi:hypothetical protein
MPRAGKQVQMMRQDGYVTAAEVSRATGRDLSTVHSDIQLGKVPGKRIGWGWYVDIHRYCEKVKDVYPEGTTIDANLKALRMQVMRPADGRQTKIPEVKKRVTRRAAERR